MSKFWKIFNTILLAVFLTAVFFYFKYQPTANPQWGLTFSYQEAQGLGFDWKQMYLDVLADLKPKNLRLMTYWEDVEPVRGTYNFSIAEQTVQEAARQNVNVILVVGRKQPRWPECHQPSWYNSLPPSEQDQALLNFVEATVKHFQNYPNITTWQVENEPFFGFGPNCPKSSEDIFKAEVALVKHLDARPILATDSGDRGGWFAATKSGANEFGFTLYRVSYDEKYGGYYKYPLPAAFYRVRSGILQAFTPVEKIYDVELQMEPWFTQGALNTPIAEHQALMNPKIFASNISFAKKTGVSAHYLWGVEWWYWMAQKNNDWGMWQAAKDLFAQ